MKTKAAWYIFISFSLFFGGCQKTFDFHLINILECRGNFYYCIKNNSDSYSLFQYPQHKLVATVKFFPKSLLKPKNKLLLIEDSGEGNLKLTNIQDSIIANFRGYILAIDGLNLLIFNMLNINDYELISYPSSMHVYGKGQPAIIYYNYKPHVLVRNRTQSVLYDIKLQMIKQFRTEIYSTLDGNILPLKQEKGYIQIDKTKIQIPDSIKEVLMIKQIMNQYYIIGKTPQYVLLIDEGSNIIADRYFEKENYYEPIVYEGKVLLGIKTPDSEDKFIINQTQTNIVNQIFIRDSLFYTVYYQNNMYRIEAPSKKVLTTYDFPEISIRLVKTRPIEKGLPIFLLSNQTNLQFVDYTLEVLQTFEGRLLDYEVGNNSILMILETGKLRELKLLVF